MILKCGNCSATLLCISLSFSRSPDNLEYYIYIYIYIYYPGVHKSRVPGRICE
jgi:hypothetical protein